MPPEAVFEAADFLPHCERIEARELVLELPALFLAQLAASDEALRRGAALFLVTADLAASLTPFALLFHRHAEEVAPLAPELEQFVEISKQLAVFEPFVAEELPDVGVVLLLHVGLVVLVIRPRTGLFDAVFPQPVVEVEVEELAAVVAVDAQQVEGLAFPDGFKALEGGVLAAVPHGAKLGPAA